MDDSQSSIDSPPKGSRRGLCDFEDRGLLHFLEILSRNQVLSADEKECKHLCEMVAQVKAEQVKVGKTLHTFEFYPFNWVLDIDFFRDCIKDVCKNKITPS